MICAILLAAGRSRRMGTQKLLLDFAGTTVVAHIADQLLRAPLERVLAVVAPDAAAVTAALAGREIAFVANPDPEGDMLSSVRCGLRGLPAGCEAVLVALGDQPAVDAGLIGRMIEAFRAELAAGRGRDILVPVHAGRRGHPVLFSSRHVAEILADHDRAGLRGLLAAHPGEVLEVPCADAAVLADMDLPEDYRRELARR